MAAKIGGDSDGPIAEINIVPFVDIILVVLIIFMVTTPFILKPSIPINLPKAGSGSDTVPSQLSIAINANGETTLNGKPATDEEISQYAQNVVVKEPTIQAIISADKEVAHGRVVTVIDVVKSSGVKKFAISIDKE